MYSTIRRANKRNTMLWGASRISQLWRRYLSWKTQL